jgi:hypothetical protein
VPLPVPLAPDVTLSQPSLLAAVHGQLPPVVTATLPGVNAAATVAPVGLIEYVQPLVCVTLYDSPATAMTPTRCGPVFGSTV